MFASESVALKPDGFEFIRDVAPGEAIYVTENFSLPPNSIMNPEYVFPALQSLRHLLPSNPNPGCYT